MKSKRIIFLYLLLICLCQNSFSQTNEGTEFWFGFMEHRDIGQNTKVAMITAKQATSGVVQVPNASWSMPFSVRANEVTVVYLPGFTEVLGSETKGRNGVRITSAQPVSVYIHQFFEFRSEATAVLPVEALGTAYYTMGYSGYAEIGEDYPSEFLIIATQDETSVDIKVSDRTLRGRLPGMTFSVELNAGETYQVQGRSAIEDLTGSLIEADKKIVVMSGNRWTEVPSGCSARDNLLEQMFPIAAWGSLFVSVPNANVTYDLYRILAAEDNTVVAIEGALPNTYTLNAGEFVEFQRSRAALIRSNQPIQVAQYIIGAACNGHVFGDPSMVMLNSVEQTRDTVTIFNSAFQQIEENYVNIITQTRDVDNVFFDGQLLTDLGVAISTVGDDDAFSYVRLAVSTGAHTIISEGCGIIATAYGYGPVESYAYSGGAGFSPINANPIPEGGCLNDTILFDTGLSPERFSFFWDLGDGTTTTEARFQHSYPSLGNYPVELIIVDECLEMIDTLNRDLLVTLREAVDATDAVSDCAGEPIELRATDLPGARYEWTGPGGYTSEAQFPVLNSPRPDQSGDYSVIGIISGCATFPAITEVSVFPLPEPMLGPDTIFCGKENSYVLDPGIFERYHWSDGSVGPTYIPDQEGITWVDVSNEFGCIGRDSVLLRELCSTTLYIPNAFSPNNDGVNDTFGVFATGLISIQLKVFDRWGGLVFESSDPNFQWDGMTRQQALPEGVYVWQAFIEGYGKDGSVFSETRAGSLALIR